MAATDQTYRNQRVLDVVFGASCLLMLVAVFAMFQQDYDREFKHEARKFRDVEEAVYQRQMLDLVPDQDKREAIKTAENDLKEARADRAKRESELKAEIKRILPKKVKSEAAAQGLKADYDSKVSLYDIEVEHRDNAPAGSAAQQELDSVVKRRYQELQGLKAKLADAQEAVEQNSKALADVKAKQKADDDRVTKAEDRLKSLTEDFDRFAKLAVQKRWGFGDWFRKLPVIDAFASPTRIQQTTLTELPIDYNFKEVTRFDRCTTCHLGIDRKAFSKEALQSLTADPSPELSDKLKNAREMLAERRKLLGNSAQDSGLAFGPNALLLTKLSSSELTPERVNEYCAHPRLDLFVDGNSPHPSEKFGCTICHGGQGSATDFGLASHTPDNWNEREHWEKIRNWEPNHFWDFPMLPKRFLESSCLKCHHQVTDLLPEGNRVALDNGKKDETPGAKVVRGYNLVRENGCFGCHDISGIKNNRWVGPDLRLEPPVEELNTDGSPKGPIDPLNPPGTMRKVGPALNRLAEKTNETWAWNWIRSPRTFRPDTKMPHFYGLSNNSHSALEGTGQEDFPDTEIHSIVHYLFTESGNQLKQLSETLQLPDPPPATSDVNEGRRLFTEKGCLACHSHTAMTKAVGSKSGKEGEPGYLPAIDSHQNFGPNLSRVAAKLGKSLGDKVSARRWLTAWIVDPKRHSPRTYMPVTHLTPVEAAAVADWLLSQPADWKPVDVPPLKVDALKKMAEIYLAKATTPQDARSLIENGGLTKEEAEAMAKDKPGADELHLLKGDDKTWQDNLQWYVGKKSIGALGCFGCHNIPGFENAKPIGTPLNDWGKKDPERIAFEDVVAYVERHHQRVEKIGEDKDLSGKPIDFEAGLEETKFPDPLKQHARPYEEYFYNALAHHSREGFLQQKLREPRSYDFDRLRSWEDRLRMPQFQFARRDVEPPEGENKEQALARAEAEAREEVMTFILGLLADPVPLKYVYDPSPERLAQAKGQQLLDKFNCVGCHQVRSGQYDLKLTKPNTGLDTLEGTFKDALSSTTYRADHRFENHNAWFGRPQTQSDRASIHAIPTEKDEALPGYALPEARDEQALTVRLTQAVRFDKKKEDIRDPDAELPPGSYDIPAGTNIRLNKADIAFRVDPDGGTFPELLVPYLIAKNVPKLNDNANARSGLPPPLLREGEKTQPGWLFQFLRNPHKLREVAILRMPRFNMSDEEAMTLVNYFGAVDKLANPGIGLTYPYLTIPQRDEEFLGEKSAQYAKRLEEDGIKGRTYVADSYHLLTVREADRTLCLNCHQVGNQVVQKIGPRLDLTHERLRPDWTERWIASPQRLLIYPIGGHPMPQGFEGDKVRYGDLFDGESPAQWPAPIRDALKDSVAKVKKAREAEAGETNPGTRGSLTTARKQAETELESQYEAAGKKYIKAAEDRLDKARHQAAEETDKEQKKLAAEAVDKAEKDVEEARREVGRFALNQVKGLRDLLMDFNQVLEIQGKSQAARAGSGAGGGS
jgi:mono/diheme cytochrome c family protein